MSQQKAESSLLIRFQDCDPFNHLNNGKYIDYFMNAREDHLLNDWDFNIYKYAMQTGESWIVSQNHIAYLAPALLNETVIVQSHLIEWGEKHSTVEMQMWDKNKTKLKSLLWSKSVHFNVKKLIPIAHSEEIIKKFDITKEGQSVSISFDERIAEIKKEGYTAN